MALHPDHSEPVVATGQLAGVAPDAKVRHAYYLARYSLKYNYHCQPAGVCATTIRADQ